MARSAASAAASGGATKVNTERWCAASAWTSSSATPGTEVSARSSAASVSRFRPSEKLGTHSTRGAGIGTSGGGERVEEPAVQRGVAGDDRAAAQDFGVVRRAPERGHHPARLADEHDARRHVPGRERELPEG